MASASVCFLPWVPVLSPLHDGLWAIRQDKPFLAWAAFGHGVYHSSRKPTRTPLTLFHLNKLTHWFTKLKWTESFLWSAVSGLKRNCLQVKSNDVIVTSVGFEEDLVMCRKVFNDPLWCWACIHSGDVSRGLSWNHSTNPDHHDKRWNQNCWPSPPFPTDGLDTFSVRLYDYNFPIKLTAHLEMCFDNQKLPYTTINRNLSQKEHKFK